MCKNAKKDSVIEKIAEKSNSPKPNLAMITQSLLSGHSAETVHIYEVASNMTDIGYNVVLYVPMMSNISSNGKFGITYIPVLKSKFFLRISFQIACFLYIFPVLLQGKIDCFYVRHGATMIAPPCFAKLFRIPYVLEVNSIISLSSSLGFSKLELILAKFIERIAYSLSDRIIVISDSLKKQLLEYFRVKEYKINVIPNGANVELFRPKNIRECQTANCLDASRKYVGFVGHLHPWQGIETLIKTIPLIQKEVDNAIFVIVGDGTKRQEYEDLAKRYSVDKYVIFKGAVDYAKIPDIINCFDICVAPGNDKNDEMYKVRSPLKIYEYLSCGKPVVAGYLESIDRLFAEEQIGVLVTPGDQNELCDAIVKMLKNENLCIEMGRRGREITVANLSWSVTCKKINSVIKQLI